MLNLKLLSNNELDHNLMTWIKKEKEALKFIIPHIAEVNCRKLYLEYAYPSLRVYLEHAWAMMAAALREESMRRDYPIRCLAWLKAWTMGK